MDWHVTWQDPIALLVVVLCVAFAMWLQRRAAPTRTGCAACPAKSSSRPPAPGATMSISTSQLGIGRRRSS